MLPVYSAVPRCIAALLLRAGAAHSEYSESAGLGVSLSWTTASGSMTARAGPALATGQRGPPELPGPDSVTQRQAPVRTPRAEARGACQCRLQLPPLALAADWPHGQVKSESGQVYSSAEV